MYKSQFRKMYSCDWSCGRGSHLKVFSHPLCSLELYVTSDAVKLQLLHYFSLMCVTMLVFSVCVKDTVHLLYMSVFPFSACGKAVCDGLWFIMRLTSPPAFGTDVST